MSLSQLPHHPLQPGDGSGAAFRGLLGPAQLGGSPDEESSVSQYLYWFCNLEELSELYELQSSAGGNDSGCVYIAGCTCVSQLAAMVVRLSNKHPRFYFLTAAVVCLCPCL